MRERENEHKVIQRICISFGLPELQSTQWKHLKLQRRAGIKSHNELLGVELAMYYTSK